MKKFEAVLLSVVFLSVIFTSFLINHFNPSNTISIVENRNLQQQPVLSSKSLFDGTYFRTFENYYTDQFFRRDQWLKLYTRIQLKTGKALVNNLHVTKNQWILAKPQKTMNYDQHAIDQSIQNVVKMNQYLKKTNKNVYYVSTPNKVLTLDFLYPDYLRRDDSIKLNHYFLNELSQNNVDIINLDKAFKEIYSEKELQNLYFRTDHHWNSNGAFAGFKEIMQNISPNKVNEDKFAKSELTNKLLLGSWNKQLYGLVSKKERIPMIVPKVTSTLHFFVNANGTWMKREKANLISTEINKNEVEYGDIYTWDIPYWKITNESPVYDQKILIYKDSYFNPTALLFASQFSEVIIADLRNVKGVNGVQIADASNADIVLFMYNNANYQGPLFQFGNM